MEKIIIIGGGGHAKVLISIVNKMKKYSVLGYTDIQDRGKLLGALYLGDDQVLSKIKSKEPQCKVVLGMGSIDVNLKRRSVVTEVTALGFQFLTIVSPDAIVQEDVILGAGTVVFAGSIIQSGTRIGEYAIVNTGACIDHDCQVGDFVHVACGAVVCGGVTIGNHSFIGAGSTIIQYKKIVQNCLVGAGATVVHDCLEEGFYLGTPAQRKTG